MLKLCFELVPVPESLDLELDSSPLQQSISALGAIRCHGRCSRAITQRSWRTRIRSLGPVACLGRPANMKTSCSDASVTTLATRGRQHRCLSCTNSRGNHWAIVHPPNWRGRSWQSTEQSAPAGTLVIRYSRICRVL